MHVPVGMLMKACSRTLVAALSVVVATVGFARASDILIGTGEYPPYTSETADDQGCVIKIVRAAYEAEGRTIDVQFMSWPRNLFLLSHGDIDASAYWAKRPDRIKDYIFTENPVSTGPYIFISRKDDAVTWDTFEDLQDKTIIVNSSYTYTKEFYDAIERYDINAVDVASISQNLKMLLKGRADLTIMETKVFEKYVEELSEEERSGLYINPKPVFTIDGFLIFSRVDSGRSRNLAETFDQGYEKIRQKEDLQDAFRTCGL
jgi:polar amino acid transport system substrate-binding protein